MSKVSKTARASAGVIVKEKKVIPDEVYIKNLRNDLDSGLYVAQEGARALLRAHDAVLADVDRIVKLNESLEQTILHKAIENEALYKNNLSLTAELEAAKKVIVELEEELGKVREVAPQLLPVCGCRGISHNAECVLSRRSDG